MQYVCFDVLKLKVEHRFEVGDPDVQPANLFNIGCQMSDYVLHGVDHVIHGGILSGFHGFWDPPKGIFENYTNAINAMQGSFRVINIV